MSSSTKEVSIDPTTRKCNRIQRPLAAAGAYGSGNRNYCVTTSTFVDATCISLVLPTLIGYNYGNFCTYVDMYSHGQKLFDKFDYKFTKY